jgi:tetratricopeptide (TPR) repeat protein
MKKIFYIFIFLLFSNNIYAAQDREEELNKLFNQLKNTYNNLSAKEIESKIWKLWTTHPSEQTLTDLLEKGSYYMSQNQLTSAHNVFSKAIELDPNWAEAWNKRATVLYLMGNYDLSQNDIDMVLSLEKRHFGALAGQGLVQTALNNYQNAINSYKEVEKIYPTMQSPKLMIPKLKELIKKQSI